MDDFGTQALTLEAEIAEHWPSSKPSKSLTKYLEYTGECRPAWMMSSQDIDFDNFEFVMSMASMDYVIGKLTQEELNEYVSSIGLVYTHTPCLEYLSTEDLASANMEYMLKDNDNHYRNWAREYPAFVALCAGLHPDAEGYIFDIITLNYDCVIEKTAQAMGIGVNYGKLLESRGAFYDLKIPGSNSREVKLLKIHGSINWYAAENDSIREDFLDPGTLSPKDLCEDDLPP